MATDKFRVTPDVCTYLSEDEQTLNIEVSVPGVNKEDIRLRMLDDSFNLMAPGKDVEYVTASAFCCPVKSSEAQAKYENGCLKISVPFRNPYENAVQVPIG
jgi:HSP20 family molecular chaperone IbpA